MKIASSNSEENTLINLIRSGDETAANKLYNLHVNAFFYWARKTYPQFPHEELADIYQESFITFFYQIREGTLTKITSSVKTYLFAIGKNRMRNELRKRSKFVEPPQDPWEEGKDVINDLGMDLSIMERYQHQHQASVVKQILAQIGEPCKTVLELAFFHRYTPEAIAAHMNYTSEASARVRKVKCLRQLGNLLDKMGIEYEQLF